jgi:predicted membrane protein
MKNTFSRVIWGLILVLFGIGLAGRAFGLYHFNLFFNGWWTLFIIIPCALGLPDRDKRTSSMIGLGVGLILLLWSQGLFHWYVLIRILVAFIFIIIGFSIIFRKNHGQESSGYSGNQNMDSQNYTYQDYNNQNNYNQSSTYNSSNNESYDHMNSENHTDYNDGNSNNYNSSGNNDNSNFGYNNNNNYNNSSNNNNNYNNSGNNSDNYNSNYGYGSRSTNHTGNNHFTSLLSGRNVQFVDEVFTGAVVSSVLGSVQFDLRNAIFQENAFIQTTCILGGVDIFVPPNVKVVNNCNTILAGIDNNVVSPINPSGEVYTLYINGTCILGGIEVKY